MSVALAEEAREDDEQIVRRTIRAYCSISERLEGSGVQAAALEHVEIGGTRVTISDAKAFKWLVEMSAAAIDKRMNRRPIEFRTDAMREPPFERTSTKQSVPESLWIFCQRLNARTCEKLDRNGKMKTYSFGLPWEDVAKGVRRTVSETKEHYRRAVPLMAKEVTRRSGADPSSGHRAPQLATPAPIRSLVGELSVADFVLALTRPSVVTYIEENPWLMR